MFALSLIGFFCVVLMVHPCRKRTVHLFTQFSLLCVFTVFYIYIFLITVAFGLLNKSNICWELYQRKISVTLSDWLEGQRLEHLTS